jgi:lipopolysaccharide export system permease protein
MTVLAIQRYVALRLLTAIAMTLGMLVLSVFMIDMLEQARTVGNRAELSLFSAATLSALKMPMLIQQTLPFAILAGAMIGYRGLARSSEVPAMRAAGISTWRLLAPLMVVAGVIGVLAAVALDPLAARGNQGFERLRDTLTARTDGVTDGSVWLRHGDGRSQIVVHARARGDTPNTVRDVEFFIFERAFTQAGGEDFVFSQRVDAETAVLRQGYWDLTEVTANAPGAMPIRTAQSRIATTLAPEALLGSRVVAASRLSLYDLPGMIAEARAAGLNPLRYELRFHQLLATPLLFIAMGLIGAIFCLRLDRLGGTGRLILWGTLSGFVLFFVSRLADGLALTGAMPAQLGAWSPPLAALFAVLAVVAYREDG